MMKKSHYSIPDVSQSEMSDYNFLTIKGDSPGKYEWLEDVIGYWVCQWSSQQQDNTTPA